MMPAAKRPKTLSTTDNCCEHCITSCKKCECTGGFGFFIYGFGFIAAAVYYIGAAGGFWAGVLGALQALVWPAMLIYQLFVFLGA